MIENINLNGANVSASLHAVMYDYVYGYNGVFKYGRQLAHEIVTNNEIKIYDGLICNQGRFMRIVTGSYETIEIENGTSGVNRTDFIVAHFETDGITETHDIRVLKGTTEYTTGNIHNGDTVNELPLYEVKLEGLNIVSVKPLFEVIQSLDERKNNVGNENKLLNGGFVVWQRGTSFSGISNKYTADRWQIKNAKGNTKTVARSSDVPTNENFAYSIQIVDELSENTYLRYNLDDKDYLKGTYTLSFWYKSTVDLNTYIIDNSNTVHLGKVNASADWKKATYTFTCSKLTAINVIHAMLSGTAYVTGVKLETGTIATPFSHRPFAEEFEACKRYYETTSIYMTKMYAYSTTQFKFAGTFVKKRGTPTITVEYARAYKSGESFLDATKNETTGINTTGFMLKSTFASAITDASHTALVKFDADAEIY